MQVQANGISLEYELKGAAQGDVVVLIRGLGTQMIEWPATLLDTLSEQLRVLTFDNRDAGLSEKLSTDYVLADMAADIAGLLDALSVERAHIFGISMGGMIAQRFAINHPQRCLSMTSMMSATGNPEVQMTTPEALEQLMRTADGREEAIALSAEQRVFFGSPKFPETFEWRHAASTRAYDRCYCPEGVGRQQRAIFADGNRVPELRQLKVPSMVLHGAADPLILPGAGEETALSIPGARWVCVDGLGHNVPVAYGAELGALLLGFYADL